MYRYPPTLSTFLLVGVLLATPSAHAAKLYKWVDESGTVHFTEKPPHDKNTEKEIAGNEPEVIEPAPVDTRPLVNPQLIDQEASLRLTQKCQLLLDELNLYSSGQSPSDSAGNPIVVSDEMRSAKILELQSELDQHCR